MATIKDKIGLAMIPSVYDGGISTSTSDYSGTVYSLLPIQHTGPNLVANGAFDQDSDWDYQTGWTIANGIATYDNFGTAADFRQNGIAQQGKTYILKFDTLGDVSGNFGYAIGGSATFFTNVQPNQTYEATVVATSNDLRLRASDTFTGSIDNVSLQLISNGDFDFERSSDATRIGSDGYIKNVEVISDELVQNRDFEQIGSELVTNGNFEDGENGWYTISGNFDIIDGKAVINHTNDTAAIEQSNVAVAGKTYRIEFTISDYVEGRIRLRKPFINGELENNPRNGTFVYYGEAVDQGFQLQTRFIEDANYKVDNISVKEVGQNWTFSGNAFISNGVVSYVDDGSNTNSYILQQNTITAGNLYKLSFDVTRYNSGLIQIETGTDTGGGVPAIDVDISQGVGSYHTYFNANNSFFLIKRNGSSPNFDFDIDNISVKEVTRDTDIPRLDFSNAAQPSLLLEPQRTNLVTHSEDFEGSFWQPGTNSTLSSVSDLNPSGTQGCYRLQNPASSSTYLASNSLGIINNDSVFSVYVKSNTGSNQNFGLYYTTGSSTITAFTATTEWQRFQINPPSGFNQIGINNEADAYSNDILIYGAQLETGSYATSYIPTNGETNGVTRNKDRADNAGDNIIFNDEEGVLYAEIAALANSGSDRVFAIQNSSNTQEYINLRIDELANRFQMVVRTGNANSTTRGINVINSLEFNKVAVRYKQGESFRIFANGDFEDDTSSAGQPTPNGLNEMFFTGNFEGKVRSILYFDKALTNEELIHLTSSDITQVLRNYNRRGELLGATYESAHVQTKLNELF